ncbi:hypothetical protein ACHAP9_007087 [Verticillium nonalfalfae]
MEMTGMTEYRPQHGTSRLHRTLSAGAAALQEQAGQELRSGSPTLMGQLIVQVDEALAGWMGFASARYDDHNASVMIRKSNRAGQEGEGSG